MASKPHKPVLCPLCDQGVVHPVRIEPCDVTGNLCAECEAFWDEGEPVCADHFSQISSVANRHELSLAQIKLVRISS